MDTGIVRMTADLKRKLMTKVGAEAARAYDAAAIRLHGEFAILDFPAEHKGVAHAA